MTDTPTTLDAAVEALERAGRWIVMNDADASPDERDPLANGPPRYIEKALVGLKALRDAVGEPGEVERRLRGSGKNTSDYVEVWPADCAKAADLIALLRAERDALRAELAALTPKEQPNDYGKIAREPAPTGGTEWQTLLDDISRRLALRRENGTYDTLEELTTELCGRIRNLLAAPAPPAAEPVAWADSEGLERPIDAEAMKLLRQNPTVESYWRRFSVPLYLAPPPDRVKQIVARIREWAGQKYLDKSDRATARDLAAAIERGEPWEASDDR